MINHTPECQKMQQQVNEFDQAHPNACRHCGGAGVVDGSFPVPYGMGSAIYPSVDLCQCLEAGNCPLCNQPVFVDAGVIEDPSCRLVCPNCNWDSENPTIRPDVDCYCYETAADNWLETDYEDRSYIEDL